MKTLSPTFGRTSKHASQSVSYFYPRFGVDLPPVCCWLKTEESTQLAPIIEPLHSCPVRDACVACPPAPTHKPAKDIIMQGKVKWFDSAKKFGFITLSEGGKDVFVHADDIQNPSKSLNDGDQVEFEVTQADKGPQAKDVRVTE